MSLPVSPDLISSELESAKKILEKWIEKVNSGLPVIDEPGDDQQLDLLIRELCGELRVCAGKCGNLAEILLGD